MTASDVKLVIAQDLNEGEVHGWHRITKDNIDQYLVEPKIIDLLTFGGQKKNFWLVFDEAPNEKVNGYLIVFDDVEEMFGLATKTTIDAKGIGFLVGLYRSFADALNNM